MCRPENKGCLHLETEEPFGLLVPPERFRRFASTTRVRQMPRLVRILLCFVLIAAFLAGVWGYAHRQTLAWQWASYQVGVAASFDDARRQIARFEHAPDAPERLRVLVAKWGTGNPRFDQYLAQYLTAGESSTALRRAFSEELARRPELLPRWAHFWCWQASLEPDRQIASVLEYLDTLALGDSAPSLTWRELLDVQAIFTLSGDTDRAAGIRPETWRDHYRVWRETRQDPIPTLTRPKTPLPR